jgi:hypothetical protein
MTITQWLKQRLDTFELRVRAGRIAKQGGRDVYYCAGWADGYKAAQKDARAASRDNGYRLCSTNDAATKQGD